MDPTDIIDRYGADTARWHMLSDSPPERDLDWTEAGIEGAWRFTQRAWRLVTSHLDQLPGPGDSPPISIGKKATDIRRAVHKTIAAVTDGIDNFRFNTAVAQLYELANTLAAVKPADLDMAWVLREGLVVFVRLIEPMMPHLAEELWSALGEAGLIAGSPWPEADTQLLQQDDVTLAVQVNGKLRDTLTINKDADSDTLQAAALALPKVQNFISGKDIRKIIVVPGKIVNIVV